MGGGLTLDLLDSLNIYMEHHYRRRAEPEPLGGRIGRIVCRDARQL